MFFNIVGVAHSDRLLLLGAKFGANLTKSEQSHANPPPWSTYNIIQLHLLATKSREDYIILN